MVFTPITVVNGSTPMNATWGNNAQTQYTEAVESFQADLLSGYVQSGLVATKDGSIANQLDVTAGVAYVQQADFTKRVRQPVASTQTTVTASTTYHLYLQPDGTWYWSTANSPATGSLSVAQVTTDGSGNILAVTDERNLNPTLLPNLSGELILPNVTLPTIGGQASAGSFGVAPVVAQAVGVHVTATTLQTILTYTPAVSGRYRISGSFYMGNSANELITFGLSLTQLNGGTIGGQHFILPGSTTSLDGSATTVGHGFEWSVQPYIYSVANSGPITISYQDPAGTPNDFVNVYIERLS